MFSDIDGTGVPTLSLRKDGNTMATNDDLITYILSLTPEQIDKLTDQLPRLTALLSKSCQLDHLEQPLQNQ